MIKINYSLFFTFRSISAQCSVVQWLFVNWPQHHGLFPVHGIFQARVLEQVAISYCRGASWPRDGNHVSCISCSGSRFSTTSATWEALRSVIHWEFFIHCEVGVEFHFPHMNRQFSDSVSSEINISLPWGKRLLNVDPHLSVFHLGP